MDYAILGDTYSKNNNGINYLTGGVSVSGKAAKLNKETKMPTMVNNWISRRPNLLTPNQASELEKMQNIVNEVASPSTGYDVILGRLGLSVTGDYRFGYVNGYRKLKTAPKVPNSSKKIYYATKPVDNAVKEVALPNVETIKLDEPREVVMKEEPVAPAIVPPVEMPKEVRVASEYHAMPEVSGTRASRYKEMDDSSVINTPERFQERSTGGVPLGEESYAQGSALSRAERSDYRVGTESRVQKVQVGEGEQVLNMISEKIHGNDSIFAETSQIKEETQRMIHGTSQLNARNEQLALEKEAIIEKIRKLNERKAEKARIDNRNAKEAFKLAQKDNDEATHVYRDLTEQLKILRSQLKEAESSLSEDDESYGMRIAA